MGIKGLEWDLNIKLKFLKGKIMSISMLSLILTLNSFKSLFFCDIVTKLFLNIFFHANS